MNILEFGNLECIKVGDLFLVVIIVDEWII